MRNYKEIVNESYKKLVVVDVSQFGVNHVKALCIDVLLMYVVLLMHVMDG
jgi:hypothetical protein